MRIYGYSIPLKVRFRNISKREGIILRGEHGWGEFSPFNEYGAKYSSRWFTAALEAERGDWPKPVRSHVPINCIIPAVGPEMAAEMAVETDCRTAKIKVAEPGQADEDDVLRVEAVRDVLGPSAAIRIDANGGWSSGRATRMIRRLQRYDLEYVEQPCATAEELREVRRSVAVPIAADESVRLADDPSHIAGISEYADLVILKAQPLGGVRKALQVYEACGLPATVSSALETSIGLAAGLALAATLPELPFACGLGSGRLLSGDVAADPLQAVGGELKLSRPSADLALLHRYTMPEERLDWWKERIRSVMGFLGDWQVIE